jgi:hypothetical protein
MSDKDTKDTAPDSESAASPAHAHHATAAHKDAPKKSARPKALYFVGERNANGEPVEHLAGYGIDARDYDEGDPFLARLTDDQIEIALDSKLYRRTKPDSSKE